MKYKAGDTVQVVNENHCLEDIEIINTGVSGDTGAPVYFDSDAIHYYETKEDALEAGKVYNYIVGFKSLKPDLTTYTDEWTCKPEKDGNLISPERKSRLRNELLRIAGNISHGEYKHHGEQKLRIVCESFTYVDGIIKLHNAMIVPETPCRYDGDSEEN